MKEKWTPEIKKFKTRDEDEKAKGPRSMPEGMAERRAFLQWSFSWMKGGNIGN